MMAPGDLHGENLIAVSTDWICRNHLSERFALSRSVLPQKAARSFSLRQIVWPSELFVGALLSGCYAVQQPAEVFESHVIVTRKVRLVRSGVSRPLPFR